MFCFIGGKPAAFVSFMWPLKKVSCTFIKVALIGISTYAASFITAYLNMAYNGKKVPHL